MKIIHTDRHALHDPQFFLVRGEKRQSAEQPARADVLLAAAQRAGHEISPPDEFGLGPIADVHTPEYAERLDAVERTTRGRTVLFYVSAVSRLTAHPAAFAFPVMAFFQIGIVQVHRMPVAIGIAQLIGIFGEFFCQNLRICQIGNQAAHHRAATGKIAFVVHIGLQRVDPVHHLVELHDGGIILIPVKILSLCHRHLG